MTLAFNRKNKNMTVAFIRKNKNKFTEKYYVHNIFITFSQQILSGGLLLIVISGQKKSFKL